MNVLLIIVILLFLFLHVVWSKSDFLNASIKFIFLALAWFATIQYLDYNHIDFCSGTIQQPVKENCTTGFMGKSCK